MSPMPIWLSWTLIAIGAAAIFTLGWYTRALVWERRQPPQVPPAPDGEDPNLHDQAYREATTGPHRVQRTSFGYPAHTMPGVRNMRPVGARRRGPQVVASPRPPAVYAADGTPPFHPDAEITAVMNAVNGGDR